MDIIVKILIIVIILLFYLKNKNKATFGNKKKIKFTNNGYSKNDAAYTMPIIEQNMITPNEADYIKRITEKSFKDSEIIGGFDTNIRKSQTTWLYKDDPIIYNIIKRICDQYGYPIENAEPLQVVKYKPGGFYNDHHDSCCDTNDKCTDFVQNGGQRVLTVLIYLNDDFEGGATKFSELGTEIKPPKYGSIIFRPLADNSNTCHPLGLHKGMPVTSGTKIICNLWIREGEYK